MMTLILKSGYSDSRKWNGCSAFGLYRFFMLAARKGVVERRRSCCIRDVRIPASHIVLVPLEAQAATILDRGLARSAICISVWSVIRLVPVVNGLSLYTNHERRSVLPFIASHLLLAIQAPANAHRQGWTYDKDR